MEMLLAFAVGFVIGGQGGSQDRHDVADSIGTIRDSEEVAALIMVVRSHAGHVLRGMANVVDGAGSDVVPEPDLVDRVRHLVQPQLSVRP